MSAFPNPLAIAMDADFLTHLENRATERAAQTKGSRGKGKAKPKATSHSACKIDPPKRTTQDPPPKLGPSSRTWKKPTGTQGGSSEWPVTHLMGDANLLEDTGFDKDLSGLIPSDLLDPSPPREVMTAVEELLQRIRSFKLQTLHEMGSVCVVDRALGEGLMAEFSRLSRGRT